MDGVRVVFVVGPKEHAALEQIGDYRPGTRPVRITLTTLRYGTIAFRLTQEGGRRRQAGGQQPGVSVTAAFADTARVEAPSCAWQKQQLSGFEFQCH